MKTWLLLAAAVGVSGCYDGASYVYGEPLAGMTLQVSNPNLGIHPDTSVLEDPNNPFRNSTPGAETKWQIQGGADHVPAFYSWATLLARQPGGESQFYAATQLVAIYQTGQADQASLPKVRELAVRAFQSVLDNFPDAVTYDASGTIAYELVTPSYKGVVELGGTVTGGWVLVKTSSGADKAVKP
jgi:hypothetical protein